MPTIELSEETMRKLRAFRKIVEVSMLQDVLLKEEMLVRTMAQMFDRNPEFVCEFVSDTMRVGGEQKQKEQAEETRKRWGLYA
mgnify:CR=1 FL=1